jgi:hypothetical protein
VYAHELEAAVWRAVRRLLEHPDRLATEYRRRLAGPDGRAGGARRPAGVEPPGAQGPGRGGQGGDLPEKAGPLGDRVRWEYRVFVEPYRRYRDVPPTDGTAELRNHGGEIAALTLASSRESVRRRDEALLKATVADERRRTLARDPPPIPADALSAPAALFRLPPIGRGEAGAPAPLILLLAGLATLAAAVVGARCRRVPWPGRRARTG